MPRTQTELETRAAHHIEHPRHTNSGASQDSENKAGTSKRLPSRKQWTWSSLELAHPVSLTQVLRRHSQQWERGHSTSPRRQREDSALEGDTHPMHWHRRPSQDWQRRTPTLERQLNKAQLELLDSARRRKKQMANSVNGFHLADFLATLEKKQL